MLALQPPRTVKEENKTLRTLGNIPKWKPYLPQWLKAYVKYRLFRGNPWTIKPDPTFTALNAALTKLYDNRAGGGPLARIRRTAMLPCCAMCGSHHNGTLDHYLPKAIYPEFAILPSNLVPACMHCNSGAKGVTYQGTNPVERFFHPYFDKAADHSLWRVTVLPPYAAPTFKPGPLPHFGTARTQRISFHLGKTLGEEFELYCATQWALLPGVIRVEAGPNPSAAVVRAEVKKELARTRLSAGLNGWRAALLRGVLADASAMADLRSKV